MHIKNIDKAQMDFLTLVKHRKSIRNYNPNKKVPREILMRIIEAGRLAPSAANLQPWTFLLISSEKYLAKVKPCYKQKWFKNVPHILIVKGNKKNAWVRDSDKFNALETDLTIAMDHMILAAAYEGVGSCWIAAFEKNTLYRALNLNADEEIFAITPLGYPEKTLTSKEKKRKKLDDVLIEL